MNNKNRIYNHYNRKSIFLSLNDSIYHKIGDFIEVTEWKNGEGYDIVLSSNNGQVFSLHESEFYEIKKMIKELKK